MKSGYKETNLGPLPEDWTLVKIGDLFPNLKTGSTPSRRIPHFFQGDILWITSGELNYNIIKDTKEKITAEAVKATNLTIYPPGTFFIAITGLEVAGTRGRCGINGVEATTNQSCMAFYENERIRTEYLFHYYKHHGESWAFNLAQGTKQQSFNNKIIAAIQILLPPLPEQRKIAEILSTVDEKMAVIDEQLAQTRELKKGLMQRLLTKGIGHTAFKDSPLGQIPESWEVKNLEQLVDAKRNIRYGIVQTGENLAEGIPCLRVADFNFRVFKREGMIRTSPEISAGYLSTILRKNDIVFPLRGRIGEVRLVNENIEGINLTRGIALISTSTKIQAEYLLWQLLSPAVHKEIMLKVNGTTLQEIPITGLKKVLVPVAPEGEQLQIAAILSTIEDKISVLTDKKAQYQELKRGLMQQLLTGQRRVRVAQQEEVLA